MKKNLLTKVSSVFLLIILLIGSFGSVPKAKAVEKTFAGDSMKIVFSSDKKEAVADGKEYVKLTFGAFVTKPGGGSCFDDASSSNPKPLCNTMSTTHCDFLSTNARALADLSGPKDNILRNSSGTILEDLVLSSKTSKDWSVANSTSEWDLFVGNTGYNCSSGYSSFYLSSNTPGERKITASYVDLYDPYMGGGVRDIERLEISVNFVTATTITKKPTATTSTVVATPAKPVLSLTTTAKISTTNQSSTLDPTKPVSILSTQKLTYSGTTSANAKVTFTIKSDPIIKEVTADASGNWTYTLDPTALDLETGDHTVSAIATDTKGIASDSVELAKFTLKEPAAPIPTPEPYKFKARDLLTPLNYVLFGGILILIAAFVILIIKRKRRALVQP